jgi:hypothetical protein
VRGFWSPRSGGSEWSCSTVADGELGGALVPLTLPRPADRATITARLAALASAPAMIDWRIEFDDGARYPWSCAGRCPVVDAALALRGFPPGHFALELQAPGLPAARREFDVIGTETIDLGVISFGEPPRFRGFVVDENGAPIEGAVVQAPDLRGGRTGEDPDAQPRAGSVRSGADGVFEYAGDLGPLSRLSVTKVGWMKKQIECVAPTAGGLADLGDIVLLPSGELELVRIPADVNGTHSWKLDVQDVTPGDRFGYHASTSHGTSSWRPRTTLGPLPIGRYVIWFFETDRPPGEMSSTDRPPAEPSSRHAYRWEVDVRAGETTTIDVGAEW